MFFLGLRNSGIGRHMLLMFSSAACCFLSFAAFAIFMAVSMYRSAALPMPYALSLKSFCFLKNFLKSVFGFRLGDLVNDVTLAASFMSGPAMPSSSSTILAKFL